MKVNEIVRESQIDEALPLLSIPMMLSALVVGMKAFTVYDMYDILSKNQFDIDNMTNDELLRLFAELVILFVPGGSRFTNEMIIRMLPAAIKKKAIKLVASKLKPMAAQLRKMKKANRAKYAANPKELAKTNAALTAKYQEVGRQIAAQKLKGIALGTVGVISAVPLTHTYYGKIDDLDKQYSEYKNGNQSTKLFGTQDQNTAYDTYKALRYKYVGELTVGLAAALASTPAAKLATVFTNIVGKVPGVGGLLKLPLTVAGKAAALGGPALAIAMQTDAGQKFLSNALVELITKGVGTVSSATASLLASAIDSAAKAAGFNTDLTKKVQGHERPANYKVASNFDRLAIYPDPKNPNIKYIRGVQITGPDGYVLNTIPRILAGIKDDAELAKRPNPVDQLKFNPALTYPEA